MRSALMIQGTGSDVGKSLIVAGLARALVRRGLRVRPFKPQNMSNNAAVTIEGGEIGRAQALQAKACGVPPSVHMNPLLLKPESDRGSQIIVQGHRVDKLDARSFMRNRARFLPPILESFSHLREEADVVLIEGAGSPAEINLRDGDLANMGFACAAGIPVLLVGDIHRGGVIASLVGTLEVIGKQDAAQIKACLVNNFRGDVSLFDDGVSFLERTTGIPCAGVVPHFADAVRLPAEDAVALESAQPQSGGAVTVAVPRLARIANFDDLDPLRLEADVNIEIVHPGSPIPAHTNLILLPGSKSTIGDLKFLRDQGWDVDIYAHVRRGGRVLGLCGGYQMLGRKVHDPHGIEGPPETVDGLGLLNVETILEGKKSLTDVSGTHVSSNTGISGYEMHLGVSQGPDRERPFAVIDGQDEGAISTSGLVEGSYLHGIFAADSFRQAYVRGLGGTAAEGFKFDAVVEATLDDLARHLEEHVNIDLLLEIAANADVSPAVRQKEPVT